MKFQRLIFAVLLLLLGSFSALAQARLHQDIIIEEIQRNGCALTEEEKVKVCKFDYKYKNQTVEAFIFRPVTEGKFPALMLIPGYQGTAAHYFTFGVIFAKLGYAAMTVSTPGFGKTDLKPDFLGKNTVGAYTEGYERFKREDFVDRNKLGIFGYSRGAIAASLMIAKLKDVKATVLGGGIFDLKKAYDELTIEGIRENIKAETGLGEKAFKERSALFKAKKINGAILIIHGEKDLNAPTNQAYLLNEELKKHKKDVELKIIAGQDHRIGSGNLLPVVIDFFSRKLKGQPSNVKTF